MARLNMNNRTGLYRRSARVRHQCRHVRQPFRDKGNALIMMDGSGVQVEDTCAARDASTECLKDERAPSHCSIDIV